MVGEVQLDVGADGSFLTPRERRMLDVVFTFVWRGAGSAVSGSSKECEVAKCDGKTSFAVFEE